MILSTDSTANLPVEFYTKYDIKMIPMQINLDDKTYNDLSKDLPVKEFYAKMSSGSVPTTAQINEFAATEYLTKLMQSGEDVLHISFSSALSGTTATMLKVAEGINKANKGKNKLVVIDSLNAAAGEGLLVLRALKLKNEGKTIDEIASEITAIRNKACAFFIVQDLKYLVRGGRLSKISGVIGNLLKIKPVLRVNEQGQLVPYKKVISRRLALKELYKILVEKIGDDKTVLINHSVCEDDARAMAEKIKTELNITPIVTDLTQVIGCHTGPGLMAVFFFAK